MKVIFRADASSTIGIGHVTRCVSLACSIQKLGGDVIFLCKDLPGKHSKFIESKGFFVKTIAANWQPAKNNVTSRYDEVMLRRHAIFDAVQTQEIIGSVGTVDWLVLDSYGLGFEWEKLIRPIVSNLMVIDDFVDRPHFADLLLNQNILSRSEREYAAKTNEKCRVITGPQFSLLDDIYERLRKKTPPRQGKVKRILVYFGGADSTNLTGKVLRALQKGKFENLSVAVVLPASGPHRANVEYLAEILPFVEVHDNLPNLANLIAWADLAIGAAGSSSWERVCLGLPSLVVSISEDQRLVASGLEKNGLARWIGHHDSLSCREIIREIKIAVNSGLLSGWSLRCRNRVDGAGAHRVAQLMMLNQNSKLVAR
jgi:UDP-2,4-diacetamido-2,4,6-trideoxy-beta-L-altropyranose hydrolase